MINLFSNRYINLKRYKEIVGVFYKYGFGVYLRKISRKGILVKHMFSSEKDKDIGDIPRGKRLKIALEELGPTFIKLGQILSTRYDMLPKDIVDALSELQDDVYEFELDEARSIFKEETGYDIESVFLELEKKPMAAASIGQVYRGKTVDGERVVIKIQRPNIENIIKTDIEILRNMAKIADKQLSARNMFQLSDIIEEFSYYLNKEIDYTYEGQNAMKIAKNFKATSRVKVPKIYWKYTTKRVLIMEEISGIKVSDIDRIKKQNWNLKKISKNLFDIFTTQIFIHELFHGDPHPGNIMIIDEERIGFVDFGIVGIVDNETKKFMVSIIKASRDKNVENIIETLLEMGAVPEQVKESQLKRDLYFIMSHYYDMPIEKINISDVLNEILKISFKHKLRLPSQLTLLIKASITIEGTLRKLEPSFSPKDMSEDIMKRLYKQKFDFKKDRLDIARMLYDGYDEFKEFPKKIRRIVDSVEKNKVKVNFIYENEKDVVKKFEGISERLTFAVIVGSLIIGSTILLGADISKYGRIIEIMAKLSFASSFIIGNIYIWKYVLKKKQ